MELAKRDDVPVELTWDLSLIYPTEEAMLADAQKMKELSLSMEASYKGNLTDAATINHCLDDYQEVYRLITLTANYCDLAVSVDYYNSANQTRNDRINSLISEIFSRLTFIESELSEQSEDVLNEAMQQSDTNRCYLAEILRNKAHRLSPETESGGRIHTSTMTVAIMPEVDDVEVQIDPKDYKFDVFRASGNGGQCVNTTDSAVRLTHFPSGIVISCQDEKSQLKNKDKALKILRARLYDLEQQKQHDEMAELRKSQVGTGDRSEKIRTYNFPQGRVTDHRIKLTLYKLDAIMNGDLDEIIDSLIAADQAAKLSSMQEEA